MKYGYVRDRLGGEQGIEKQKKMIGEVDTIIADTDKSKLRVLLENIKQGDSIHISDMSRITRNIYESIQLYEYLSKKGAELYINREKFKPISDEISCLLTMTNVDKEN